MSLSCSTDFPPGRQQTTSSVIQQILSNDHIVSDLRHNRWILFGSERSVSPGRTVKKSLHNPKRSVISTILVFVRIQCSSQSGLDAKNTRSPDIIEARRGQRNGESQTSLANRPWQGMILNGRGVHSVSASKNGLSEHEKKC